MARRGQRKPRQRVESAPPAPQRMDHVGVRELSYDKRGEAVRVTVNPSKFQCSTLAAQLADEWVIHVRAAGLLSGGEAHAAAVRQFCDFVDERLLGQGMDPNLARLDSDRVELVDLIHDWESSMIQVFGREKSTPYSRVRLLLLLISRRASAGLPVLEKLRLRAEAPPVFKRGRNKPLDEFSNAERLALRDAARGDIRALEARLKRGAELLEEGRDPREGGDWHNIADLVWASRHGVLTVDELFDNLPKHTKWWPEHLTALLPPDRGRNSSGRSGLVNAIGRLLFPNELDVMPFRVLLLLEMPDATPEEVHDLMLEEIEFTPAGVRLVQRKMRAWRVRADFHPATDEEAPPETENDSVVVSEHAYTGDGVWGVGGLLKRLIAATVTLREAFDVGPRLFIAAQINRDAGALAAGPAKFQRAGRRFTSWIAAHRDEAGKPSLAISQPHEVRRLRKTAKTVRAVALGGTVTDLAGDDHHVEVFRTHYAHGTTAHILAGRSINRAQQWVFHRASAKPVLVDEEAEARLEEPEIAEGLGLSTETAKAMVAGELDMGITNCRNPYDSQFTQTGKLCHVAPAMCFVCPNAVIFTSHLPRLVLFADHVERMRAVLDPPRWQATWGRQHAALTEVLTECADKIPAARQEIADQGLTLDLPLGLRSEFDR
ncbi:hypothetical protein RKD45_003301 [Streptomyces griseus]